MGLLGKLESFGKALWDTGQGVVDAVADVSAIVDGAGAVGDFMQRVGTATHLDDVAEVGGRLAGWAERVGLNKFLRAADAPILDGGQLMIAGMKLTTGIGEPDDGERFGLGGARAHGAAGTLRSARPTADWAGDGASSYAARTDSQVVRTCALAAADHEVHRVLATEAYQINFHRDRLDDWYNWLADVGLVTFALGLIPGVGQGLKATTEAHAVLAAVGSSSMELYQLSSEVGTNAATLQQLVGRYDDLARTAHLAPVGPDDDAPAPPPSPPDPPGVPPSDGPPDDPADPGPQPPAGPAPRVPARVAASAPSSAGAGSSGGGAAPVRAVPAPAAPPMPEPAGGVVAPAASGPLPAAVGAVPPAPMSAAPQPMNAASGIPAAAIKEAVQAALRSEAEKRAARDRDRARGEGDRDGEGGEDEKREAAPGDGVADRPPVHIEMDVDVERLGTPIAVTLERESPVGPPPAPAP